MLPEIPHELPELPHEIKQIVMEDWYESLWQRMHKKRYKVVLQQMLICFNYFDHIEMWEESWLQDVGDGYWLENNNGSDDGTDPPNFGNVIEEYKDMEWSPNSSNFVWEEVMRLTFHMARKGINSLY